MPSSVVVSDRESLERNFVENGISVFCQASFGAGAYAIGGTLLGFPPLTVPAALLTTGALLTAMTVCPSSPSQSEIFGVPPGYTGGQCNARYTVNALDRQVNTGTCQLIINEAEVYSVLGPIRLTKEVVGSTGPVLCAGNASFDIVRTKLIGSDGTVHVNVSIPEGLSGAGFTITSVVRQDGQPDNCGSQPSTGGQIITNNANGDTIDNSKVENNSNYNTVIPILVNVGGINGTLNLNFGGIKIGSLFPLQFDIEVGGVRFRIGEEPDGSHKLRPVNPDPNGPSTDTEKEAQDLKKLIQEIKECVCKPDIDLDMLFVPFVNESDGCDIQSATLLVPKGSVPSSTVRKLENSAELAKQKCEDNSVVQKEEVLLYSATTASNGSELFTPDILPEVASLRIKITAVNNADLQIITLYPAAKQRKFGSVSYVIKNVNGGGDYVYIFDEDTFLPLPKRAKTGKLRILFKRGISFEIYDTGERF